MFSVGQEFWLRAFSVNQESACFMVLHLCHGQKIYISLLREEGHILFQDFHIALYFKLHNLSPDI